MSDRFQEIRLIEAMLFASAEPLSVGELSNRMPDVENLEGLLEELGTLYANRGVNLVKVGQRWAFRTAPDLTARMSMEKEVARKLPRVAVETLAIIAYHQPVTRAEVEEIRGVALSRGTLDTLLEAGWIKPKGRRRTPGKPVTWGTTDDFLDHFGLESLEALPGHEELKAAGLLDTRPAITALGARGLLPEPGEAEEEDEIDEEEASEILRAEFGATVEPETGEAAEDDSGSEHAGAREGSEEESEAGGEPDSVELDEPSQVEEEGDPSEQTLAEVHPIEAGRKTGA